MSTEFTISKRCGNEYTGHLFPGQKVTLNKVTLNTATGHMRAEVWTAVNLTMWVPIGSVSGLREAIAAGSVEITYWTPGVFDDSPVVLDLRKA